MSSFKRPATPPLVGGALSAPLTPGAPLPKTIIPPSPDGPRVVDSLAPTLKHSPKLQAVPGAAKRSLTVGVKKPTFKAARVSLNILKVRNGVVEEKQKIGLMDPPGGKLQLRLRVLQLLKDIQRSATSSTPSPIRTRSKLCLCIDLVSPHYVHGLSLIEPDLFVLMLLRKSKQRLSLTVIAPAVL
jgi:hypothetical protein